MENTEKTSEKSNFLREWIDGDIQSNRYNGRVATRFPPEPNGYLHIGHAKSICLNFGIAQDYKGVCHLRMDDTNPSKEDVEYVDSIQEDIRWLGFKWLEPMFFASDYYEELYELAVYMIKKGRAYVCELTPDQMREYRGTLKEPGKDSPWRNRSAEENLDLFTRMKNGEFPDGSKTLRAKIDMASPNINMRDPVMYRILRAHHHRTGDKWCIYPMYDYAHPLSDAREHITHSICTLEFEDHRPLYDWFLEAADYPWRSQQREFARLNLTYTVMSKRKLLELVQKKYVSGWDDPRMPTICGLRRRGFTPESIRNFADRIGVAKANSTVDMAFLEFCVREDLNRRALRRMAVLNPLKVVITNFPEGKTDWVEAENNPEDPSAGTRKVPFTRVVYIEKEDFMENPPKKFFRLAPGAEVRLKSAYLVRCVDVIKDAEGNVTELRCEADLNSRGGEAPDGRAVKGTLHWVSAETAVKAEVRLYSSLFNVPDPDISKRAGGDYKDNLNPESLIVIKDALCEPALGEAGPGGHFQFLRMGYFTADPDSKPGAIVFNRTVTLKDTWAKEAAKS